MVMPEYLTVAVEKKLPEFVKACQKMIEDHHVYPDKPVGIVMHQDAFAANFTWDELALLGTAIKYAGERGIGILVVGHNEGTRKGESVNQPEPPLPNYGHRCDSL